MHATQVEICAGTFVAGFGRGKWEYAKEGEVADDAKITYVLQDHNAMVCMNNKMQVLRNVLNDKRKQQPTTGIQYHDLTPKADGPPGAFTLEVKTSIQFCCTGAAGELGSAGQPVVTLQSSAARMAPLRAWSRNGVCGLVWAVKWNSAGLSPVRPQIMMLDTVRLGAGQAVAL